jgi:hypothetical protein
LTDGYITLAFGHPHYLRIAKNLALSLRRSGSAKPIAIVTDLLDRDLSVFDVVIPLDSSVGGSLLHKLSLDGYSPWDRTIFLDSDCLVVRNPDGLFERFSETSFGVVGEMAFEGAWFGVQIEELRASLEIDKGLPKFNSGFIYWDRDRVAKNIFRTARSLWDDYDSLGFGQFRKNLTKADEPLFAIAMSRNGVGVQPDDGTVMNTPIGLSGSIRLDLSRRAVTFTKWGRRVEPAVMHFCGYYRLGGSYQRESFYLRWRLNHSEFGARLAANTLFAAPVLFDRAGTYNSVRSIYRFLRRWR